MEIKTYTQIIFNDNEIRDAIEDVESGRSFKAESLIILCGAAKKYLQLKEETELSSWEMWGRDNNYS